MEILKKWRRPRGVASIQYYKFVEKLECVRDELNYRENIVIGIIER